jgi:uncharacterized protein YceK
MDFIGHPSDKERGGVIDYNLGGVYRGVRVNCMRLAHPRVQGSLLGAIDLPFSFVADTLILPIDLAQMAEKKEQ